ncbi:MAG: hypothetical protein PHT60_00760 [Acidiphilium sp.]|nr:hypothetical protein [Acidiphilium sp.]MDD4934285.1 hypothetical protein [Acidiphilium sp.]
MNEEPDDQSIRADDALSLRAGAAPISPPLIVALMILALGMIGPIVFVRDAVPSLFLTIMAILLPVAGVVAMIASVESLRRRRADPHMRARAIISPDGIMLLPRPNVREHYRWHEIAAAHATKSAFMVHLKGEDGKSTRRAIRYGGLETPVAMIEGRIAVALQKSRDSVRIP